MIFIVLCHIIGYYKFVPGNTFLGQIFNVGVYIFFIISGYLYGGKEVTKIKKWLKKRWCKIVIPVIILTIIDIVILRFLGKAVSLFSLMYYGLNLQGLSKLSTRNITTINLGIENLGSLWFTTIIMLCYCLLPIIQWIHKKQKNKSESYGIIIFLFLLISNFLISVLFNITFIYFIVFYFGYLVSKMGLEKKYITNKKYIALTLIMISIQIARFYMKLKMDETQFYIACVGMSHFILGFWMFITTFKMKEAFSGMVELLGESKPILWLDENSYYIYLTHGLFCMGKELNVFTLFDNIFVSSLLFIILTLVMTYILKKISDVIIKNI